MLTAASIVTCNSYGRPDTSTINHTTLYKWSRAPSATLKIVASDVAKNVDAGGHQQICNRKRAFISSVAR